jgi:HAMP domain-containing protein
MKRSLSVYMFGLVVIVAIAVAFATFIFLRAIYLDGAVNRARTVSDNVNAFGAWVSQYSRVYVKDGRNNSYLAHEAYRTLKSGSAWTTGTALSEDEIDTLSLYSKNPALAQREFSEVVQKSEAKAKFRLTSHNVMNPANAPDEFEQNAIKRLRAENLSEYSAVVGNELRYTSALIMTESCLKCHATAEAAPKDVTTRYGTSSGYGFKVGELGGIISVRVPLEFSRATFAKQFTSMGATAYLAVALVLCALIMPLVFLKFGVINKIQKMTDFAEAASLGRASNDALGTDAASKNELSILGTSIKRMNSSLQIAINKLRDRPSSS